MEKKELAMLADLLVKFRNDSVDREEWDKRDSVLFDVYFQLTAFE